MEDIKRNLFLFLFLFLNVSLLQGAASQSGERTYQEEIYRSFKSELNNPIQDKRDLLSRYQKFFNQLNLIPLDKRNNLLNEIRSSIPETPVIQPERKAASEDDESNLQRQIFEAFKLELKNPRQNKQDLYDRFHKAFVELNKIPTAEKTAFMDQIITAVFNSASSTPLEAPVTPPAPPTIPVVPPERKGEPMVPVAARTFTPTPLPVSNLRVNYNTPEGKIFKEYIDALDYWITGVNPDLKGVTPSIVRGVKATIDTLLGHYVAIGIPFDKLAVGIDLDDTIGTKQFSQGRFDPIIPVIQMLQYLKSKGVHIFAISHRRDTPDGLAEANAQAKSFGLNLDSIILLPDASRKDRGNGIWKQQERQKLIDQGFIIMANFGDEDTDFIGNKSNVGEQFFVPFSSEFTKKLWDLLEG